jgi:hypothetical protein
MNKKAQGLSVTTIVIAALAVLVLVVLAVVFLGRLTIFQRTITGCEGSGGVCKGNCTSDELEDPINREGKRMKCADDTNFK